VLIKYGFNELGLNKIWTEIYDFDSMKVNFCKIMDSKNMDNLERIIFTMENGGILLFLAF
jgi:dihydroorotate dehydrogenase